MTERDCVRRLDQSQQRDLAKGVGISKRLDRFTLLRLIPQTARDTAALRSTLLLLKLSCAVAGMSYIGRNENCSGDWCVERSE